MDIAIGIAAFALAATGALLLSCSKHISGMFKIASYRIEQAMAILLPYGSLSNKVLIHKKIVLAVHIHRQGMELCNILLSNFTRFFFFIVLAGVTCLSINLYGAMMLGDTANAVCFYVLVLVSLMYILIANYAGQELTDHYNNIFTIVYNVQWYVAPLDLQKMILFLLQRGTKNFHLVLGGLFVVSMESASMLISTSLSYFTFLYSTWQDP